MTTRQLAPAKATDAAQGADGLPAQELLDRLARVYPGAVLLDHRGRARWMSGAASEIAGRLPDDDRDLQARFRGNGEASSIRAELRSRGLVSNRPMEIESRCGKRHRVDVSIWPLALCRERTSFVAVARRRSDESDGKPPPQLRRDARAMLDGVPDAVLAVDDAGRIAYANPAAGRLLGQPAEVLLQAPVAILCDDAEALTAVLACLCRDRPLCDRELELRRPDGSRVCVAASSGPLPSAAGIGAGTVLYLRDRSADKESRAELERSNAELEHCLNALAHDLRSPLISMLGFSRLLRQDYGARLDETGTHFLDRIEQAGQTMESLLHHMLEFSRIAPAERRRLIDPRGLLLQIEAELKPRLEAAAVALELPVNPPPLYSDRTRLYQLFSNLIGNAIDHMGPCADPRICVDIHDEDGAHRLSVRDSGRGIPAKDQERIFQAFQSLGPTPSGGRRGTGIGLAIVKRVAETHGGRVWVESRPGAGATFHVLLPKPAP